MSITETNLWVDEESVADNSPCENPGHKNHKTACFSAKNIRKTNAKKHQNITIISQNAKKTE